MATFYGNAEAIKGTSTDTVRGALQVRAPTTLTIAGGVVTATQSSHLVDTQGGAASDDLDTVNGLENGQFLVLGLAAAARNVVIKHGTGNILCPFGMDITLDVLDDQVVMFAAMGSVIVTTMKLATASGGGLGAFLASTVAGRGGDAIGYTRTDGSKNKVRDASDTVGAALDDLDDAAPVDVFRQFAAGACRVTGTNATTLFSTIDANARVTIPANTVAGTRVWAQIAGNVPSQNGADTLTLRLMVGASTITALSGWDAATNDSWMFNIIVIVEATGAGGLLSVWALGLRTSGGGSPMGGNSSVMLSVNLTADVNIDVSATWSSNSANNQADLRSVMSERRKVGAVT